MTAPARLSRTATRWGLSGGTALEKRPVSFDSIESSVLKIKHRLRATGEREVPSIMVGEAVMDSLRELDQVAYVRFASVYRSFQDIEEFRTEIEKLSCKPSETK